MHMVSILFALLGFLDFLGGLGIILSEDLILPQIAKYIGVALLIKGVWTILLSSK